MVTAMEKMGQKITTEELEKIMKYYDKDHNGTIEKHEFEKIFCYRPTWNYLNEKLKFANNPLLAKSMSVKSESPLEMKK